MSLCTYFISSSMYGYCEKKNCLNGNFSFVIGLAIKHFCKHNYAMRFVYDDIGKHAA